VYTPFPGDQIVLDLGSAFTSPAGDAIDVDLALGTSAAPPPDGWLPSGMSNDFRVGWSDGRSVCRGIDSPWHDARRIDPFLSCLFSDGRVVAADLRSGWQELIALHRTNRIGWQRLMRSDSSMRSLWRMLTGKDPAAMAAAWGGGVGIDESIECAFLQPGAKDNERDLVHGSGLHMGAEVAAPWIMPPAKDRNHTTRWGRETYAKICTRKYQIPGGLALNFNLETPIEQVGNGDHVDAWFDSLSYDQRCSHREPSGWRDAYTYVPPDLSRVVPSKKVWIIMNSVLLTRVSDNKPLDVASISMHTDMATWCWGFEATINSLDSYQAIEPTSGTTAIKATVNGYNWLLEVEQARESETFGRRTWTVSGRSISAELAAPAAVTKSYVETADRTAVQLIEAELSGTGYTLDYQGVDWLVSGGALSVSDLAPMAIIKRIAEAAGGVVQSAPGEKKLLVLPRYKGNPWGWSAADPDIYLNEAARSFSSDWQPGAQPNAVIVSGTTQGVMAKVIRTGTAGDRLATMVTDPLITATEVAAERGRTVLAAGQNFRQVTIDLPLMTEPDLPGLLVPGMIVDVNQASGIWRGQVTGVRISGTRNRGLSVRQIITVERYYV
jgi:hypothetical protein